MCKKIKLKWKYHTNVQEYKHENSEGNIKYNKYEE